MFFVLALLANAKFSQSEFHSLRKELSQQTNQLQSAFQQRLSAALQQRRLLQDVDMKCVEWMMGNKAKFQNASATCNMVDVPEPYEACTMMTENAFNTEMNAWCAQDCSEFKKLFNAMMKNCGSMMDSMAPSNGCTTMDDCDDNSDCYNNNGDQYCVETCMFDSECRDPCDSTDMSNCTTMGGIKACDFSNSMPMVPGCTPNMHHLMNNMELMASTACEQFNGHYCVYLMESMEMNFPMTPTTTCSDVYMYTNATAGCCYVSFGNMMATTSKDMCMALPPEMALVTSCNKVKECVGAWVTPSFALVLLLAIFKF